MEILRKAGHNIQEKERRILLGNADKDLQRTPDEERWQYTPGRGAGPNVDAMTLDEPWGDAITQGVVSDEEESSNTKSAATASLPQDMSDIDDEATVAFDTSDTDDDKKPSAKANLPPQDMAEDMAETDDDATAEFYPNDQMLRKKPPARASIGNVRLRNDRRGL
jgi:hypothetical protein